MRDLTQAEENHRDDEDYIHPLLIRPQTPRIVRPEPRRLARREALIGLGGVGAALLLGACAPVLSSSSTDSSGTGSTDGSGSTNGSCSVIPTETIGPYPASSLLSNSSIYRQDVTEGQSGVPLSLELKFMDVNNSCQSISNAAIYIWHCNLSGSYSGYSSSQNGNYASASWLRGVQVTDSEGKVTFNTIYPGWYNGRITHIHFEVFLNNSLTSTAVKISQLGFPQDVTTTVYNSSLYSSHGQNTSVTSFSQDNVFSDGTEHQIATMSGSVSAGYTASLEVGVGP